MKIRARALPLLLMLAGVSGWFSAQAQSADEDLDGIADARDECPYSPPRSVVDDRGCALDNDFDGIPDGIDRCADTELGAKVNLEGCAQDQTPGAPAATAAQPPAVPEAAPAIPVPAEPAAPPPAAAAPAPAEPTEEPAAVRTYPVGKGPKPGVTPRRPAAVKSTAPTGAVVTEIEVPVRKAGAAAAALPVRAEPPQTEESSGAPVTVIEIPISTAVPERRPEIQTEPVTEAELPAPEAALPAEAKAVTGPVYLYGRPIVVVPVGPRPPLERAKPTAAVSPALEAPAAPAVTATPGPEAAPVTFKSRRVHFAAGSQQITAYSMSILDTVAERMKSVLEAKPDARFALVGYVDPGKESRWADTLSLKRAELVRTYLVSKGVDGEHLEARGAGASEPLREASDKDAARLNPRVEIHALLN